MAQATQTITVIGNITEDPSNRTTQNGDLVSNFSIASTPRFYNKETGEWQDGDPTFFKVTLWKRDANNFIASAKKGDRVIAIGAIAPDNYTDKEGVDHRGFQLKVDEIGLSTKFATVTAARNSKSNSASSAPAQPTAATSEQAAPAVQAAAPVDDDDADFG